VQHGVLTLSFPKPERFKPKIIAIDAKEHEQLEPAVA
jgi:hypothetical protein